MAEENRRPYPQLNGFREWVRDELKQRRSTWPTPVSTPFVRMTSCNEDDVNNYKYFSLGLHGFDDGQSTNIFDLTYGARRDVVGYAYRGGEQVLIGSDELKYISPDIQSFNALPQDDPQRLAVENRVTQAQTQQSAPPTGKGAHPVPGIVGVQIKRSGLQAPLIAEVHWQCYNQQQLEFLRNHFLVVGSYIVLEWGQKYHDDAKRNKKLLDFRDTEGVMSDLLQSIVKGRKYVIDKFVQQNSGNYDFVVGQVGNFTIDLDPATNVYKCSTRIVSLGENVWGMSTTQTVTIIDKKDKTSVNKISDIHSYFEGASSPYTQKLNRLQTEATGVKYCRPQQPPMNNDAPTAAQTGLVSPNPHDAAFISWAAFTTDIFEDIIAIFKDASSDPETKSMYDKLCQELSSLLGLGGVPDKNKMAPDVYEEQSRLYELEFIGNHKYLRSVDPDALIIITPEIANNSPGQEWLGNGIFGEKGSDQYGRLTQGIWINAEMVREAFLNTTTLQAAIQQILSRMSVASGNYWQLRLFYDDEISVYKVIDHKFDHNLDNIKFYVFNSHADTHHNETVDIKFDSAFPPELITQMMIVSMIQTSAPEEQKALFERYPLINSTSPFMFAVNWTSLRDVLKDRIKTYRNGQNIPLGTLTKVSGIGPGIAESNNLAVSARLNVETSKGSQTGKTPAEAGSEGTARTVAGSPFTPPSLADGLFPPAPRSTVTAPPKDSAFTLDTLPVKNGLNIKSGFGARNAPTAGASTSHKGVDIAVPQGTPVYATNTGIVTLAETRPPGRAEGGFIKLAHEGGKYETWFMHLSDIYVAKGQKVTPNQLIGRSGGTPGTKGAGTSTGPHLHFEIRENGSAINPRDSLLAVGVSTPTTSTVQTASSDVPSTPTQPIKTPNATELAQTRQQEIEAAYKIKFGNNIINLIWPTVSILRNKITQDGYANLSNKIVNAFISPFPTKTSVEIKVPGITGISISDGFMVDKLPFIFANYGVFQVTELTDAITDKGWYTTVRGYFKMIWPDGRGGTRDNE